MLTRLENNIPRKTGSDEKELEGFLETDLLKTIKFIYRLITIQYTTAFAREITLVHIQFLEQQTRGNIIFVRNHQTELLPSVSTGLKGTRGIS